MEANRITGTWLHHVGEMTMLFVGVLCWEDRSARVWLLPFGIHVPSFQRGMPNPGVDLGWDPSRMGFRAFVVPSTLRLCGFFLGDCLQHVTAGVVPPLWHRVSGFAFSVLLSSGPLPALAALQLQGNQLIKHTVSPSALFQVFSGAVQHHASLRLCTGGCFKLTAVVYTQPEVAQTRHRYPNGADS